MKIYTKSGDQGKTSLFSGERVNKNHRRIEACGDIDELNSSLGAVAAGLGPDRPALIDEIHQIQSDLFQISAWLATKPHSQMLAELPQLGPDRSVWLENAIDRMETELPPLTAFILPGGDKSAAWTHVARAVCRRAERRVVAITGPPSADQLAVEMEKILTYINRLSDYLFMLARYCNHLAGVSDIYWEK